MADDNYSDAEPSGMAQPPVDKPEGEEKTEGETAIIPQSLCPGMKEGDEVTMRIDRVLENDYEISYPDKGGKEEPGENKMAQGAPLGGGADVGESMYS